MKYSSFLVDMQLDVTALAKPVRQAVEASESAFDTLVGDDVVRDLRSALLSMRADERSLWISVGIALKTLGDQGRGLWLEWSSTSPKFDPSVAAETWQTFAPSATSYQAVFAEAARKGWLNPAKGSGDSQLGFDSLEDTVAEISEVLGEKVEKPRFNFVPAAEFAAGKPMSWIIKDLIPCSDLIVLYGSSGAGKTFHCLNMTAAVAMGVPYCGKRVEKGRVAYIVAEGASGFRSRLHAFTIAKGISLSELDIIVMDGAPNLMSEKDSVDIAKSLLGKDIKLLVVDTFARSFVGNESSAEDVSMAVKHCRSIGKALKATVLVIHHTSKSATSNGPRGSAVFRDAADTMLEVVRDKDSGERRLETGKQKDGIDDQPPMIFALDSVVTQFDDYGDAVISCSVDTGGV